MNRPFKLFHTLQFKSQTSEIREIISNSKQNQTTCRLLCTAPQVQPHPVKSALHHCLVPPATGAGFAVLERILRLGAQEGTGERADQAVIVLRAEHSTTDTTCHGSQETALALLRVVGVRWIAVVAVGVGGIT